MGASVENEPTEIRIDEAAIIGCSECFFLVLEINDVICLLFGNGVCMGLLAKCSSHNMPYDD